MSQPSTRVKKSIAAQNIFSDWMDINEYASFSLSGTWVATVHLQRSFDGGITALDVDSFTTNVERDISTRTPCLFRFGVKTGNYTSGTVVGELNQ